MPTTPSQFLPRKLKWGGGSSSESTDVDNATNGDTENQNSDDAEGDEPGDDSQPEEQPEEEQQNEGTTTSDGEAVAAVAENEQTKAAAEGIDNAGELKNKLESVAENQSGSFQLMKDLDCNEEIILNKSGSNITLDLNGYKIKHSSNDNKPLFSVSNSAEFTITDSNPGKDNIADSQSLQNQGQNLTADNYGKTAKMLYEKDVPTELTYYVTKSSVDTKDSTRTNETTYEHKVTIKGAIVACSSSKVNLIKLEGGTFNLQGGVLTQKNNCNVDGLIYAQGGSTVNMSGGYVCGASMGRDGAGAGIHVEGSILEISDGVIAGNYAPSGGGVYALNSTVYMVGGIISGNGTNNDQSGYGAGICAENSNVTITNGYITNNRYQYYIDEVGSTKHLGFGCHGGGGIAAFSQSKGQKIGSLVISGGYITGNYSAEAGGGVYAGAWDRALSGFTFSGGIIASNVAQNSEGGGIRISAPTESVFEVPIDSHANSHAYITNNTTNTPNDWGGGGVFVQGGSDGVQPASLRISNALIANNWAQGYGGGFAACPTGKTAITDTNGIAIFGNRDKNGAHLSGGTNGKNEDQPTTVTGGEITDAFKQNGHKDLFLIRKSDNNDYIAAVTGQMLGGGAANWKGTIDGQPPTTIGKYEGAQAKYMIGLDANPSDGDQGLARDYATLFITGNSSNIHGGGIMTNGDVIAGSTTQVNVYPKMKLNGTKALTGRALIDGEFKFQLLKQNMVTKENGEISFTVPSFDKDGKLQLNGCTKVGDGVPNNSAGNFAFNLGEVYSDGSIVYYLVEDPGDNPVSGVTYDKTIYKIAFETTVAYTQPVLNITYTYYSVAKVTVTNLTEGTSNTFKPSDGRDVSINLTKDKTFTNKYGATGTWTPQVTKKVDGGEMKKFKFKLFSKDGSNETLLDTKWTTDDSKNSQTVKFADQTIGPLNSSDFTDGKATFTYYICECAADAGEGTSHKGYTNDTKTFKVVVTATDDGNGHLTCTPAYYEVDASGKASEKPTTDPTFTNTYSTSLPLSGMSGVTLTYLAGAAVLCAAAAWMHIRRKANAKGGERRE